MLVGGAAAAWLLSTATASAQSSEQDVVNPVVDALTQQNPQQVKGFVEAVLPKPAPPAELEEVGQRVQGTVEHVTAQLRLPAPRTEIGEATTPARLRLLTVDDADAQSAVRTVAANPQLAPVPSAEPERVAAHDVRRASVAESPRHAPPVGDTAPELPALPHLPMPLPLPAPVAPAGACTSCGNGGSNNDDMFGGAVAHTWPFPGSGFATSQALRLISQHIAPAAGEQPGVTPD
nr:hypothetical protein [Kibdelosporangium sp. MJ126-NF4]CEL15973.1 hypothetical protein [Kibdelosporangium sp. MJ126-NF4]CTQ93897.1 hypothetical protein [Kibdelosporangium sp. MJ126-NF4]